MKSSSIQKIEENVATHRLNRMHFHWTKSAPKLKRILVSLRNVMSNSYLFIHTHIHWYKYTLLSIRYLPCCLISFLRTIWTKSRHRLPWHPLCRIQHLPHPYRSVHVGLLRRGHEISHLEKLRTSNDVDFPTPRWRIRSIPLPPPTPPLWWNQAVAVAALCCHQRNVTTGPECTGARQKTVRERERTMQGTC